MWQLELWTRPPNGKLLHVTFDPGEMLMEYREARRTYGETKIMLVASAQDMAMNYDVDYQWLVKYYNKHRTVVP